SRSCRTRNPARSFANGSSSRSPWVPPVNGFEGCGVSVAGLRRMVKGPLRDLRRLDLPTASRPTPRWYDARGRRQWEDEHGGAVDDQGRVPRELQLRGPVPVLARAAKRPGRGHGAADGGDVRRP